MLAITLASHKIDFKVFNIRLKSSVIIDSKIQKKFFKTLVICVTCWSDVRFNSGLKDNGSYLRMAHTFTFTP